MKGRVVAGVVAGLSLLLNPYSADALGGAAGQKYDTIIRSAAEKHGLDAGLVHSVIEAESNYNPSAVSAKGAIGLMQLLPETAARYGVSNIYSPEENVEAGVRYLKDLMALYRNDLHSALAAYNAGPEALKKHNGIPPYPETKRYIRKVLNLYNGHGGLAGSPMYKFRDGQGRVVLTNDLFYLYQARQKSTSR